MADLVTYEQKRNEYFVALQAPSLIEIEPTDAKDHIMEVITLCFFEAGQAQPNEDNLIAFAESWLNEIKLFFPRCTTKELQLLANKGLRKEYGEYYGINTVTLNQWIKGFIRSEARIKAKAETQAMLQQNNKPVLSEQEAFEQWRQTIIKQFKSFKETGVLTCEFPLVLYKALEEKGLLNPDDKERKELMEQAKKNLKSRKEIDRLKATNFNERKRAQTFLDHLEAKKLTSHEKVEIRQESRLIAIRKFYQSIEKLNL